MSINHDSDACLHCVIRNAIEEHHRAHGEKVGDQTVVDVFEVMNSMFSVFAEVVQLIPDRNQRRRAKRVAHDALDAAFKYGETGKLQPVEAHHEH